MTIKEACEKWIKEFNALPTAFITKAYEHDIDEIQEITPISNNDEIYIFEGKHSNKYGYIEQVYPKKEIAKININGKSVMVSYDRFKKQIRDFFPVWGMMWTFKNVTDIWWLDEPENLQIMADLGFRIYVTDELGYVFGIDSCGYDFYSKHWIPLYKARGLHWHE